ncbi:CLUMA_CG011897, isoform A [Clunio marinus]|uniref:CLUMA_CG011897, isoform A n=1 Tax=Clunio marinus TaxID=568069 RepID=A0A1J1IFL2_9DIPT|nr:CLUMA_CG011897, isoform A [Clunio marinus]
MMEQNVDELAQSYEIIDKNELDTPGVDESNNNVITPTETALKSTTEDLSSDQTLLRKNDNNNNNQALNRKYTRDDLLKLRQAACNVLPAFSKESVKKTIYTETSDMDRILDRRRVDAVEKMMPDYMKMPNTRNSYHKQRPGGDYQSGGRRSDKGNRSQNSSLIKVSLQSNEEIKLNEAKNAWKPQMLVNDQNLPEEEKKTAELLKQFRSILNKITPDNFTTLLDQLKVLNIDTVDRLDSCISLVFEKAITEPNYGASYAQLCKEVSDVFVVPLDSKNSEQKAVFKNRLITQCQREFEKHRGNELVKNMNERLKEIEDEEDVQKQEELKAKYELESFKIRRRAVGTVHFIGELYKIEMLTSKIMVSCISHLLDPSMCSEETLECLCKLLTTIGKRLEKLDQKKFDLSEYFVSLEKLADKKNSAAISSRIRFMIQDLCELRLNNWTPRKLQRENKPLTMDEIKQQVAMEQFFNKMENKESSQRDVDRGRGNQGNSFYQGGSNKRGGNIVSEDGWSTQYSKSRPLKLDMNKLNFPSSSSTSNDDIVLGGVPSYQSFTNRFSGLKEEEPDQSNRPYNGRFSGGSGNQNMNQNRNNYSNRGNRNSNNNNNNNNMNRSSASRSLQPPLQQNPKQQQFGPSRKISHQPFHRPVDLPIKSNTLPRKISAPARPLQPIEAINRGQEKNLVALPAQVCEALKKMLKAYQNDEMTLADIAEKMGLYRISKNALVLVYNWVFDQHDKERFQMTEIICEGVCRNIIMTIDLLDALKETIDLAKDLVCDLPHVYSYIGQLLALLMLKRIVQFEDLLVMSQSEIEANNGGTILKNVFKVFEQKYEKEGLRQLYQESKIQFQEFLGDDTQLCDFLKENNFDYLTSMETKAEPLVLLDEATKQKLQEMLKDPDVDAIILWINNHIKDPTENGFIRSLTDSILDHCFEKTIDGSYEINNPKLEKCSAILAQFLDAKSVREVQCLHSIKRKIVELEHPSNCFHEILSCLYSNFALTKEGFIKWRDDNDPLEQEGKGVVLKSCTSFIEFLKQDKDDESSGDED